MICVKWQIGLHQIFQNGDILQIDSIQTLNQLTVILINISRIFHELENAAPVGAERRNNFIKLH